VGEKWKIPMKALIEAMKRRCAGFPLEYEVETATIETAERALAALASDNGVREPVEAGCVPYVDPWSEGFQREVESLMSKMSPELLKRLEEVDFEPRAYMEAEDQLLATLPTPQKQVPVVPSLDEFKRLRGQAWVSMTAYHEDSGFDEGFWDKFYDLLAHGCREAMEGVATHVGWISKTGNLRAIETYSSSQAESNNWEKVYTLSAPPPSNQVQGVVEASQKLVDALIADGEVNPAVLYEARDKLAALSADKGGV